MLAPYPAVYGVKSLLASLTLTGLAVVLCSGRGCARLR